MPNGIMYLCLVASNSRQVALSAINHMINPCPVSSVTKGYWYSNSQFYFEFNIFSPQSRNTPWRQILAFHVIRTLLYVILSAKHLKATTPYYICILSIIRRKFFLCIYCHFQNTSKNIWIRTMQDIFSLVNQQTKFCFWYLSPSSGTCPRKYI